MNEQLYRQCVLQKGMSIQTSWIPDCKAIQDKVLRLGTDDGWRVVQVGSVAMPYEQVNANSQDYKRTRIASDI